MTPTEQDKMLREKIKTIIIGFDGGNWYDQKADSIMQLITADRKRAALEARIDEARYIAREFFDGEEYHPNQLAEHILKLTQQRKKK